jgi:hypothetical protein
MRTAMTAVVLASAVTLSPVVGNRMSAEVMGVVCGVAAAIPISLLILLILSRQGRQAEEPTFGRLGGHCGACPAVVVIQGGSHAPNQPVPPSYSTQTITLKPKPAERQFRVIGEQRD